MARHGKPTDLDLNCECTDAFARLTALANNVASVLTGDPLSAGTGQPTTPRSAALVMGMLTFLLRTDPNDLEALFFADGSLSQLPFTPGEYGQMRQPPLHWLL